MSSKTVSEAKTAISKVKAGVCLSEEMIRDALDKLRGAVTIVYPMNLPPYDPVRLEFEGNEELAGTQAGTLVLEEDSAQLWWAGKALARDKKLSDYLGRNEKTTIVAKLQRKGQGAPGREPVFSEEEQKKMMAYTYKKQEEFKKLDGQRMAT
ncbi:cilia- and flagella-associated protein 298-like isoform X3 [Halichondria panicea]|uniref:cilia- and flagella-associated protein 298-like isoform X3 n=1 Tax=Halichondria panicea TaxID=6063 RepID=UPI00312B9386